MLRTDLRPGDIGWIVHRHGVLYEQEHGWDASFDAYVAGPLAAFARSASPRDRIWIAERGGRFAGCIAIVGASPRLAQLRWFLVEPAARKAGLGARLLGEAVRFSREARYDAVSLWTVRALAAAARLYEAAGFVRVEERPGRLWGVDLVEERYELSLTTR
ncbi:MAG: GNAT family N-acetyltransferase [Planctomycetaceae bacterium]